MWRAARPGRLRARDQAPGVSPDHQLLVGRNHPGAHTAARRTDARAARRVGSRVEVDAEPRAVAAHALADRRGVLADSCCEDQSVEPAERAGERAQLAPDAVDEHVDRQRRARIRAREQGPHVARDAGHPEQPGLVIDETLEAAGVQPPLVHEIQDHAGVERSTPRAHRQSVERGEAHRARHAPPGVHRAHARPVAEVQHDGPAQRRLRIEARQRRRDVLVGQAMKAVAADAGLVKVGRKGEALRHVGVRPVKRGVETSDLRQACVGRADRPDRGQIVRLVQGSQLGFITGCFAPLKALCIAAGVIFVFQPYIHRMGLFA